MKHKNKAIVLGTDHYIGLAVVRSLGKKGVYVVSVNQNSFNYYGKSRFVKETLIAPDYKTHAEACLSFLINYAKNQEEKPVLFAASNPWIEFIDKYFHELKDYYLFPMDRKGLLSGLMNEYRLSEFAKKYGIPMPEMIESNEDNIYERVAKEIKYPCFLKPKDGAAFMDLYKEKAFFIKNERELKKLVEKTKADKIECFIQRIIPGPEENNYSFDCYMNQRGRIAYYTTAYKIRQWPNNFGRSTLVQQKWIPKAANLAIPFLQALRFKGFVEVEMKKDSENDKIYMTKVNVSFADFTSLHPEIGMDVPYLIYSEMTEGEIGERAIDYDTGARWRYLYDDISAMRQYVETKQKTRQEIIEENRYKKIIPSIWAKDDPWPGIKFVLFKIIRKIGRNFGMKLS